jgi:hypothetical protein
MDAGFTPPFFQLFNGYARYGLMVFKVIDNNVDLGFQGDKKSL